MSETTKVKWLADNLRTFNQDEHVIAFVWTKQDAEQITEQSITDEEWALLADVISNKADWLYTEMDLEFNDRLQLMREEKGFDEALSEMGYDTEEETK